MSASTIQYLPDYLFEEIVATRLAAVMAALGGLRISEFVRAQLEAEIVQSFVATRNVAPESGRDEDEAES